MTDCATAQPSYPTVLDDEIVALALQLEEINLYSQTRKGKHVVGNPPDTEIVFSSFQAELEAFQLFLMDQRLAESMGAAVHTDGALITDLTSQEIQSHEDRRVAIQMSNEDPEIESPPQTVTRELRTAVQDWTSTVYEVLTASSIVDFSDDEAEAGPSMSYSERQASVLEKLSETTRCSACASRFPIALTIDTKCTTSNHRYCISCMKYLFLRASKEEAYYPPRCCRQPLPLPLVEKYMTVGEIDAFKSASIEFSTTDRIYCNNHQCERFIPPERTEAGINRATCRNCGQSTCSVCKNAYHNDTNCPDDPALRQTQELARGEGWQSCPACRRLIDLTSGCNHMTYVVPALTSSTDCQLTRHFSRCPCGAHFCYVCGLIWRTCNCPYADPARILERAEEVVDLNAPFDLPRAERQRRVQAVQRDLLEHDECEHPGRFQRIFHDGRRKGLRCELCSNRHWKYILQCRHCHINVCEDCRRNRI